MNNAKITTTHTQEHSRQTTDLFHPGHETLHSILLLFLFSFIVTAQVGLYYWKKRHYSSYRNITLVGMWTIPFILSVIYFYWEFLLSWFLFTLSTVFIIVKSNRKPLQQNTPRLVYLWFYILYKLSWWVTILGYLLMVIEILLIVFNLGSLASLNGVGFTLFCYGLYFGVLGRDCAEMCTDKMAITMGLRSKSGLPAKSLDPTACGICGEGLNSEQENIFTLNCTHSYHEFCIRGWIIIGKKDTCPYCSEKVNIRATLLKNPWEKQSTIWSGVLDTLRYLVVWNPLIVFVINVVVFLVDRPPRFLNQPSQ